MCFYMQEPEALSALAGVVEIQKGWLDLGLHVNGQDKLRNFRVHDYSWPLNLLIE